MADQIEAQSALDQSYRPISRLALVGFLLGSLFAGMVAVSTAMALVQGLPVFLPGWMLATAAGGAILCFLAQHRIRNSEGTLAGLGLARWGLWLSILLGVTYSVYLWVTGLALDKQAAEFLMVHSNKDSGFFPLLKNSTKNRADLYQAFLLTLPTTARGGSQATNEAAMLKQYDQPTKDGEGGSITKFSKHPVILALCKNPDTQVEQLGGLDWKYESNSYYVARNYRFTMPEMVVETTIPVRSTEGMTEGEQRKWFVDIRSIPKPLMIPTPLGRNAIELRRLARDFLEQRRAELADGKPIEEYRETDTDWTLILPKSEAQAERVKKLLREIFQAQSIPRLQMVLVVDDMFGAWNVAEGGRVQVIHPLKILLPAGDQLPTIAVELEMTAITKAPLDPAGTLPVPLPWEIRNIRVTRAIALAKAG